MKTDELMHYFHGYLDTDWRTKEQCLGWMKDIFHIEIHERDLRDLFSQYCKDYIEGKHDSYLAHSVRGYKLTSNIDEIKKSIADDEKRLKALAYRVNGVKKRLKNENQLTLLPEQEKELDAYEVISKMENGDGL